MEKNENIQSYCKKCGNETMYKILCSFNDKGAEPHGDYYISWEDDYQIIKCGGCSRISFRIKKWFSEYEDEGSDGTWVEIFPESDKYKKKPIKFENIPPEIESLYSETISAYNAECYRLCAAGLRAVVESICVNLGIKSGRVANGKIKENLEGKINSLAEKGHLTSKYAEILHELRFMGNKALHESEKPTKDDLDIAYKIIEYVLTGIYDVLKEGAKLKTARESKKTKEI